MLLFIVIAISALLLILIFFRFILHRKKSNSVRLFSIALKSENNCHYEQAIHEYEIALDEVKKAGRNAELKMKIEEKIKLLNMVMQYQRGGMG